MCCLSVMFFIDNKHIEVILKYCWSIQICVEVYKAQYSIDPKKYFH